MPPGPTVLLPRSDLDGDGAGQAPPRPAGASGSRARRVRRYVALWVALACAAVAVSVLTTPPHWPPPVDWPTIGFVVVLAVGAFRTDFIVRHAGSEAAVAPIEAATIATFILVPGTWPVFVVGAAAALNEIGRGRDLTKRTFNVAVHVVATAVGLGLWRLLGTPDPFAVRSLAAGLIALAAFTVVDWGAVAGVLSRATGDTPDRVLQTASPAAVGLFAGTGAIGVVAAKLWLAEPILIPLLIAPVLAVNRGVAQRYEHFDAIRRDRDRLDRLVAGASDGIALLDEHDRVEVWNRALEELTGLASSDAVGRPLDALLTGHGGDGEPVRLGALARTATPMRPQFELEFTLTGTARFLRASHTVLFGADALPTGTVVVVRDLTAAHEIEQVKQDLVQRVSHELRTPLTTLNGFIETLRARWPELGHEEALRYLDVMDRQADRLRALVEGLLVKARIERVRPRPQQVQLAPLVQQVIDEVGEHRLQPLTVEVADATVVWADPAHVRHVVWHYLSNATKYGSPPVTVRATTSDGRVCLTVDDRGPGVPDAFEDQLFTAFAQASTGTTRRASGLGVGLSLVASTVDANGGRAWHERPSAGGARFALELPARPT